MLTKHKKKPTLKQPNEGRRSSSSSPYSRCTQACDQTKTRLRNDTLDVAQFYLMEATINLGGGLGRL